MNNSCDIGDMITTKLNCKTEMIIFTIGKMMRSPQVVGKFYKQHSRRNELNFPYRLSLRENIESLSCE